MSASTVEGGGRTSTIRVLIVDDHPFVREGLRTRLDEARGIEIVAEAESAEEALVLAAQLAPDLVLADIRLKDMSGIEMTRELVLRDPNIAVLVLSMYALPEYVQLSLDAGARGYVAKDANAEQILHAIEAVTRGGTYLSPTVAEALFGPRGTDSPLSRREEEILACIARGLASKQIARELGISLRTVESHRHRIKRKLQLKGQAELVKAAVERIRTSA